MGKKTLITAGVGDITVIEPLQRRLNATRVQKLASDWNPILVGTIELAELPHKGENVWHPTDGNHRIEAARIADPDYVFDAVIEYDLSEKEVAQMFLARNQLSAKVPALDQYEVGIIARDPIALAVQKALRKNGLKAGTSPDESHVAAVGGMMAVVRKGKDKGAALLAADLGILLDAWVDEDGSRFNGDIIKAVGYLLAKYDGVDRERLVAKLGARSPLTWTLDAKTLSTAMSGGGEGRATLLMGMFREAYNHRLGKARKLA